MANVSFQYDYLYCNYGENARFGAQWSDSSITLNGSNTYAMVFNRTVPGCRHIKVNIEIENTGSGTVLGRSWDFMIRKSSGGWSDLKTFTMPSDGIYTVDCDVSNYSITQIACVPSSNPGSGRTWNSWFSIEQLTVTESVPLEELSTGMFLYGVFPNRSGVSQKVCEVLVNIGGVLRPVTDVLVNMGGTLTSVPPVHCAYLKTTSEKMTLYGFTPSASGTYKICQKKVSGDHEIRLYNEDFEELSDGYFYSKSVSLTAGTLYYITVTHYVGETDVSESYLQIYKEG